jgi:uncharacterized protein involved in exopolysaccharide biosynthesis
MSKFRSDENAPVETSPHRQGDRSSWLTWLLGVGIVGLVVLAVVVVFNPAKVYQASATVKVLRSAAVSPVSSATPAIVTPEAIKKMLDRTKSTPFLPAVVAKLSGPLRTALMQPYASDPAHTPPVALIVSDGLKIEQMRGTLLLQVSFRHPDPAVAAQIANLCAEELQISNGSSGLDCVSVDRAVPPSQSGRSFIWIESIRKILGK